MKTRYLLAFLCSSFLFVQCRKPGCLESSGVITITERAIPPFQQIHLYNDINLILTQGFEESIKVEAGQNIQPNIETTVKEGKLTIRNTGSCDWIRNPNEKITVHVTIATLKRLVYDGSGSVTSTNTIQADTILIYSDLGAGDIDLHLNAKHATVHLQGQNADVTLHGKSNYCYTLIHPRNSVYLSDFEVKRMDLVYVGVRDAIINVTEAINGVITHTGNVYYKGTPSINVNYYSSGRLIKAP